MLTLEYIERNLLKFGQLHIHFGNIMNSFNMIGNKMNSFNMIWNFGIVSIGDKFICL